ncbi:MAG: hypothetical protein ABEK50_00140 [bacterium]
MQPSSESGSTLIVVLIALGFISFLSVSLAEYGMWNSQVSYMNKDMVYAHQANRLAAGRTKTYLKETLPDSSVLPDHKRLEWTLPPDEIKVSAEIKPLNSKISLNRFKEADAGQQFRDLVKGILDDLNYPDRTMRELARWIVSEEEQSGLGTSPYGGYDYSAPNREILHMDEIKLISGFKAIGIKDRFREFFTVYGSGLINPLHFSPEQWELFANALDEKLPAVPQTALQSQKTLREYLNREEVWGEISGAVPFFTNQDDSFLVDYTIRAGGFQMKRRSIMTFNYEKKTVTVKTRYPIVVEESRQSSDS